MEQENKTVHITYRNHRYETVLLKITPKVMFWGSTNHHLTPQWLLNVFDENEHQQRTLAMKDILSWVRT